VTERLLPILLLHPACYGFNSVVKSALGS